MSVYYINGFRNMFFYCYSLYHAYFYQHNYSKKDDITTEQGDYYV
jgi:hypothetical protein